jgi:hypothetical protein
MKKQGLFQRLLLTSTLALGFLTVWSVFAIWATQLGVQMARSEQRREELCFLQDGTARIRCRDLDGRYGASDQVQFLDLNHAPVSQPLPDGDEEQAPEDKQVDWGRPLPFRMAGSNVEHSWRERVRLIADDSLGICWYYTGDGRGDGKGCFVGYDLKSYACVGFLGLAGFRTVPLAPEEMIPFGGPVSGLINLNVQGYSPVRRGMSYGLNDLGITDPQNSFNRHDTFIVAGDGSLFHASLRKRTIRSVQVGSAVRSAALISKQKTGYALAVRTDDAVLILGSDQQVLNRYLIPDPLKRRDLDFVLTAAGAAVMYAHDPEDSLATEAHYEIFWANPDGSFRTATTTLPRDGTDGDERVLIGIDLPGPIPALAILPIRAADLIENGMAENYAAAFTHAIADYWQALVFAAFVGIVMALCCLRRQMRYGARGLELLIWPLFVLALGLPGWVAYRFSRRWPILEKCATCGTIVPHDCQECIRCTAEFPSPALKGTEVFA